MRKPSGSGQLPLPSHLTAIVSRVMDFVRPFFRAFSLSLSLSLSIIPTKRPYLSGEQCRRTSRDDKNISRRYYLDLRLFRELCFHVFLAIIISNISIWISCKIYRVKDEERNIYIRL